MRKATAKSATKNTNSSANESTQSKVKKTTRKSTKETAKKEEVTITLLEAMDRVVKDSRNSHLDDVFHANCDYVLGLLAKVLGVSEDEAFLISLLMENHSEGGLEMPQGVAQHLSCSNIESEKYINVIKGLQKRHYVRRIIHHGDIHYTLRDEAIEAYREGTVFIPEAMKMEYTLEELFMHIRDIISEVMNDDIEGADAVEELHLLYHENPQIPFANKMLQLNLIWYNELALTLILSNMYLMSKRVIEVDDFRRIFPPRYFFRIAKELQAGASALIAKGILEPMCENGVASNEQFQLTEKYHHELVPEIQLKAEAAQQTDLIEHQKIAKKDLFYDSEVQKKMQRLADLLNEENYQRIRQRLEQQGMRKGIVVALEGAPGCGKTQGVLELARQTGRDIMMCDISTIRNKFVGESEKRLKQMFDSYRAANANSTRHAILCLNECDALFGKRGAAKHAADKMENNMTAILLNELENLDGILICTSNLASNFDDAIERRILYKVHFEIPTAEVRAKIWQSMLPQLTSDEANQLAREFPKMNPGEMENVSRKMTINALLYGDEECTFEQILEECRSEKFQQKAPMKHIGFTGYKDNRTA